MDYNFSKFQPFRYWCYKVLPLVYDDSLSYYELLCKVIDALNKIGNTSNELITAFEELKEWCENYFESTNFQEMVDNKLDQMAEDGTLESLINDKILANKVDRTEFDEYKNQNNQAMDALEDKVDNIGMQSLATQRVGRWLLPNLNSTSDKGATLQYSYAQGSVVIESKNTIVIAYIPYNTDDFQVNNDLMLREYNFTTGAFIREAVIPGGGHGNGITYNPRNNRVYIAKCFTWNNKTQVLSNDIVVVNYDTFAVESTVTLTGIPTQNVTFISFDIDTNTMWSGGSSYLYQLSPDDLSLIKSMPLTLPNTMRTFTTQSGCVRDGIYYEVTSSPETLLTYNATTGEFLNLYNLPNFGQGVFPWNETESITCLSNKNLYILTCGDSQPGPEYEFVQLFVANLSDTVAEFKPFYGNAGFYKTVYVDANSTAFNPDGTQNKPFKTTSEVINILRGNSNFLTAIVSIQFTKGSYDAIRLYGISNVEFIGNGSDFSLIQIGRCSGIQIQSCNVRKTNFNIGECINVYRSTGVRFDNCFIANSAGLSQMTVDRLCQFEFSDIIWRGGNNENTGYLIPDDYTDKIFFRMNTISWVCEYRFRNAVWSYNKLSPTSYVLWDGTASKGSTNNYNPSISAGLFSFPDIRGTFRYVTFTIDTGDSRRRCYKFYLENQSSATYFIQTNNVADSANTAEIHEIQIQLNENNWVFTKSRGMVLTVGADSQVTGSMFNPNINVKVIELSDI